MLTKNDLYSVGLRPLKADLTQWGCNGIYCHVVLYADGNNDDIYKVEMRNEPCPPDDRTTRWEVCFKVSDLRYSLSRLTYYESLSRMKINVDTESLKGEV